jgi:hypothetical protein
LSGNGCYRNGVWSTREDKLNLETSSSITLSLI